MARIVITGANRGIGLALARVYKERGDDVVAACRMSSDELDGLGVEVRQGVEVSDSKAVCRFAATIEDDSVDILINNAGIASPVTLDDLDLDRIRRQFDVNALGPLRVTRALLPSLRAGGKVVIVTSRMGSIGDNSSGGAYGYRMSKAAANMAGVSLAVDLRPRQISVLLLHPGMVGTDMGPKHGGAEPVEAARRMAERIEELTPEGSGSFRHAEGYALPW